jgi:hypothetical protein
MPVQHVTKQHQVLKNVKGKFHPRTGREGSHVEYKYSSTLCLILVLHGGGWSTPRPGRFTPRRDRDHCTGGCMDAKNLAFTGIRFPGRPARSESLYRLSYPGPQHQVLGHHTRNISGSAFNLRVPYNNMFQTCFYKLSHCLL